MTKSIFSGISAALIHFLTHVAFFVLSCYIVTSYEQYAVYQLFLYLIHIISFIATTLLLSTGKAKNFTIKAVIIPIVFLTAMVLCEFFGLSASLLIIICGESFEISLGEGILYIYSLLCQFYTYIGAVMVSIVIRLIKK